MALGFGRKKTAPDAPIDTQNTAAPPQNVAPPSAPSPQSQSADDLGAFDLDAFATQEESGDAATHTSPLADDLTAPAAQTDAPDLVASTSGSAFDFPEASHAPIVESVTVEQREAIASGKIAAPALVVENEAPRETGLYPPQITVEKPKQKLPVAPIIGALLALGLAGGAATFLTRDNTEEEAPVTPQAPAPPPQKAPPNPPAPPVSNANPTLPKSAPNNAAPRPLPPDVKARLKALWKQGAEAKHRGDNEAARLIWQQGLQVQPGNRGFIESIAKLPK